MTSPPSPCQALLGAVRARESETNHPTPVLDPPAPAIAHAIYRATGVWHRELPILPEHVLLAKPEAD